MDEVPGEAYRRALRLICDRLPFPQVNWALTGSLGQYLQGVRGEVHDVDVQTDEAGAWFANDALREFACVDVYSRTSPLMLSLFGMFEVEGVHVEIMGAVRKRARPGDPWGAATDPREHCRLVTVDGYTVPVLSLEYEVEAYQAIGRQERANLLRKALARQQGEGSSSNRPQRSSRTDMDS
jgi:hypothetical protein